MAEYFDVLTSIINKKNIPDEAVLKHFNGWQTMVWLSNHPRAVYEANELNSARGNKYIGKLQEYKTLKGLIHIPKNTFLKSDKADKNNKIILDVLMRHFQVGKTTAIAYFNILKGDRVLDIIEMYARKNEKHMSAKDLVEVKKIRDALTAKRKILKDKE